MNRLSNRKGILPAFLVVLLLVFGPYGDSRVAAIERDTYRSLKEFNEILDIIQKNYVEEVKTKTLLEGAINGMMKELDPHSAYMSPDMYKDLEVETRGSFGGLGIEIGILKDILTVVSPIEDTPAFEAGIKAGDQIVKIDGQWTKEYVRSQGLRLLEPLFVQHFGKRLAAKHRPAGQQRVQQGAETIQVAAGVDRLPLGLLRRHVFGRPHHVAGGRETRIAEQPGDAEVGEFQTAVGGQEQVARLDVAVDDAPVVRVAQRPADVDAHLRHLAPIERASPPQFLLQAVAVDQFHRIEQVALLLAEAEQPNDVRMVELAKRLDLGLEPDAKAFFLGQGGGEQLDRGRLARLAVNAFVDRPHAAAAELADNLIGPKPFDVHGTESNAPAGADASSWGSPRSHL